MAFEVSKKGYQQINPTINPGYPYEMKYHSIGQLQTPYVGKLFGQGGDYGPPQATVYYTQQNRNYPYVLDSEFRPTQYLPTEYPMFQYPGYFASYNPAYPDEWIVPNYFTPNPSHIGGHYVSPNGKQSLPPITITPSIVGPRDPVCGGIERFEKLRVAYTPLSGRRM